MRIVTPRVKYDDSFYFKSISEYFGLQEDEVDILFSILPTRYY